MRPRSQGNRGCASARRTEMNRAAGSRVLYKYVTRKHTENAHPFLLRSSLSIPSHLAVVLPLPAWIFPPVSSSRPATLDFERSSPVSACFSTSLSACFIISASASEAFFDAISSDFCSLYFGQYYFSVFENYSKVDGVFALIPVTVNFGECLTLISGRGCYKYRNYSRWPDYYTQTKRFEIL